MIPENAKKIISTAEGKMKDATAYLEAVSYTHLTLPTKA